MRHFTERASAFRACLFAIAAARTRAILGLAFDYHMRADLVTDAIQTMSFEVPGGIWHSDQGKQFGAEQTRHLLLQKGFVLSMSRAGTPADNGYAERFVSAGTICADNSSSARKRADTSGVSVKTLPPI